MARRHWLLLPCALLGGTALAAEALPSRVASVRLVYERDASAGRCPDEATLRAAIAHRVGFAPFDDASSRVISCRVRKEGRLLRARIDVGEGAEQPRAVRELISRQDDCQELAEAIELALGIAINPLTAAAGTSPEPAAEIVAKPDEPAPPVPRPPEEARATETVTPVLSTPAVPGRPRTVELRLGVRADTAVGLGPGFAYGGALTLALKRRALSAGLEFRVLAPSSVGVGRGTFHVWQWSVLVAPCAHRSGLEACLLGSAGMLYGRAEGFAINGRSSSPAVAAGARGRWEYPLLGAHLRFSVNLDLLASLTQTHFTLGNGDGWSASPVGVSLGIGMHGVFF